MATSRSDHYRHEVRGPKMGPVTGTLTSTSTAPRRVVPAARTAPGLVAAGVVTAVAIAANRLMPQVSTLIIAVVAGMLIGNLAVAVPTAAARAAERIVAPLRPGLALAAKRLLRLGVVFLGARLSIGQIADLGVPALMLVAGTVVATFFGTQYIGRRLGLSPGLSLLVATGYSICGASAIAAMESSADADEEEVALSIGLVTVAGTVAMFALPVLAGWFGLSDDQFGAWVGASVHDVAQVVAAASTGGAAVLSVAVVVKLTRVVLLAPIVAATNVVRSRHTRPDDDRVTPPLMPLFVVGFLAMMTLRTVGLVPAEAVDLSSTMSSLLLTAALVGLGAGVRIDRLRRLGRAPFVLGAIAWFIVAGVSLAGVAVLV